MTKLRRNAIRAALVAAPVLFAVVATAGRPGPRPLIYVSLVGGQ